MATILNKALAVVAATVIVMLVITAAIASDADEHANGYIVNKVESFRIRYYGSSKDGPAELRAWLYLYGKGNPTGVVGAIGFYTPEGLKGKQDRLDGYKRPQGNMAISELSAVLDMLRGGKDVYVHWSELWKQTWLDSAGKPLTKEESKHIMGKQIGR